MNTKSGFTLLEMLVVIAIMACLMAATPFLSHSLLDRVRMGFAVRSVVARIQRAELKAAQVNEPVILSGQEMSSGLVASVRLEGVGSTDDNRAGLWLYPDGSASAAQIVLEAGRLRKALIVNDLDGRVDEAE